MSNNTLKYKKFSKKGTYTIPAKILGVASIYEYYAEFYLSFDNLKIELKKKYFVDFRLIKECNEETFNNIINNQ